MEINQLPPLRSNAEEKISVIHAEQQAWIEQLKGMDSAAWEKLLNDYAPKLLSSIRRFLAASKLNGSDDDLCYEIQQQTWLTAVEKIHEFEAAHEWALYAWLRAIAQNHIWNLNRKWKDANPSLEALDDDGTLDTFLHEQGLYEDTLESKTLRQERLLALDNALRQLSARDGEIIVRRLVDGESVQDLAVEYTLHPQSVSQIILRAKQKIRLHLITRKLFAKTGK